MMIDDKGLLIEFYEPIEFIMSERDRRIWRYYDDGCSRARLCEIFGITRGRLIQILKPMKRPAHRDNLTFRVLDDADMRELACRDHDLSGLCDA